MHNYIFVQNRIEAFVLQKYPNVQHGFFTRNGGNSLGLYASLNCGLYTNDKANDVEANLQIVARAFGSQFKDVKLVKQTHGNRVLVLDSAAQLTNEIDSDAIVTNVRGVLIGVQTADCIPILLYNDKEGVVAAAHAGWKGALLGIIQNTIYEMKNLGSQNEDTLAVLGPSIDWTNYKVSATFYDEFMQQSPSNQKYFIASNGNDAPEMRFNLKSYCYDILISMGIKTEIIDYDTYAHPDIFFSARYMLHTNPNVATADFGRHVSVVGMRA